MLFRERHHLSSSRLKRQTRYATASQGCGPDVLHRNQSRVRSSGSAESQGHPGTLVEGTKVLRQAPAVRKRVELVLGGSAVRRLSLQEITKLPEDPDGHRLLKVLSK
jgi:hypothetical protein